MLASKWYTTKSEMEKRAQQGRVIFDASQAFPSSIRFKGVKTIDATNEDKDWDSSG
jgi:hypothetical protein